MSICFPYIPYLGRIRAKEIHRLIGQRYRPGNMQKKIERVVCLHKCINSIGPSFVPLASVDVAYQGVQALEVIFLNGHEPANYHGWRLYA